MATLCSWTCWHFSRTANRQCCSRCVATLTSSSRAIELCVSCTESCSCCLCRWHHTRCLAHRKYPHRRCWCLNCYSCHCSSVDDDESASCAGCWETSRSHRCWNRLWQIDSDACNRSPSSCVSAASSSLPPHASHNRFPFDPVAFARTCVALWRWCSRRVAMHSSECVSYESPSTVSMRRDGETLRRSCCCQRILAVARLRCAVRSSWWCESFQRSGLSRSRIVRILRTRLSWSRRAKMRKEKCNLRWVFTHSCLQLVE